MYEYDRDNTNDSLLEVKNAQNILFNIPVDLSTAESLAASVNVVGLDFLNYKNILDEINVFNTYDSIITE